MGCSKGGFRPRGRFSDDFHGRRSAASVPASAASSRSYFPGTSGLMYWSDYDNIGAYAFDSSKALKAHDICTLQSGAGSASPSSTPGISLYSESWSGSGDYVLRLLSPFWTAAAPLQRRGVLLNIPSAQNGEFGRYQVCFSQGVTVSSEQIGLNKSVRFDFKPASSLMRVQLFLSEDSSADEVYISQASVSVSGCAFVRRLQIELRRRFSGRFRARFGHQHRHRPAHHTCSITKKADGQNRILTSTSSFCPPRIYVGHREVLGHHSGRTDFDHSPIRTFPRAVSPAVPVTSSSGRSRSSSTPIPRRFVHRRRVGLGGYRR